MTKHLRTNFNMQDLRTGDVLVDDEGNPVPNTVCVYRGFVEMSDPETSEYVLTQYPAGSHGRQYFYFRREDLEAMASLLGDLV